MSQTHTTPRPTGRTASPARQPYALKELVLVVVLGVVFGFAYWALVQGWTGLSILMGPAGDLAQHVLFGGWLLVAPIAVAIVRRPGAGVLAEVMASVVEVVFLGSPVGPRLFLSAAIQGVGSELPFALGRYRTSTWFVYACSGLLGAGLVFVWSAFEHGWYGQDILLVRLGVQLLSGVLLGGLLAKVVVDALARTGVVDDFAIGHDLTARATR